MKIKKKIISLLFFGLLLCQAEYQILSIPKNVFQLSSNGGFNNYINQSDPYYVIKDFKLYKLSGAQEIEAGMYEGNAYIDPLNKSEET